MTTLASRAAIFALAFAGMQLTAGIDTPAQAQWNYDRFERTPGPHKWGPRCVDRMTTRGKAGIKLFSNKDKKKATARAVANWQEQVAGEFGPQYARWELAAEPYVDCKTKGFDVRCEVSAYPCRR